MRWPSNRYLFAIIILIVSTARADIKLDFNRNNQTYNWLTSFNHAFQQQGFKLITSFNGESNLIKGQTNRWQENAAANVESEKSIIGPLSLVTTAEYNVNGLDRRRVLSIGLATGLAYRPWEFFKLTPLVRVDHIKRSDPDMHKSDQGAGYGIESAINPGNLYGVKLDANFSFDRRKLSNIPSDEGKYSVNAYRSFFGSDTVWAAFKGLEAAKKYYGASTEGGSIIKQIRQERQGDFAAAMTLPANLHLRVDGNARLSRYLYRYTGLEDANLPQRDNYGQGGGYKGSLKGEIQGLASGIVGYAWSKSNQDFQKADLDQKIELGELSFQGKLRISSYDSLYTDLLFGVTSYSNPSINSNREDRDQQSFVLNGRFNHNFNPYFSVGLTGGVNSFHQIYVSGVQSANNNQNNTYILAPFASWKPFGPFALVQSFEIQANYITFDFDRASKAPTRNRIFRRATSKTEWKLTISDRLSWVQSYLYRYEDYGQLFWNDGWQQALSWDRRRNGLETKLVYAPDHIFQVAPFFSWEKTNDYNHDITGGSQEETITELRYLADEQVKMLFDIELIFNWNHVRRTRIDFSHRIRTFLQRPKENSDYATVSMEYLF
ncbi:MAG TPA: hypothetical protein DCZ43_06095 [candidate division Zixibacteria bacterium]|nr:hypothetical protein [candidate division Zixibacteria bacterium]